jgi:hypothetical protein
MRQSILTGLSLASVLFMTAVTSTLAEPKSEAKTVTITGEGKCAKCALKESDKCQNVIQTKEDGKTVTYYIVKNDVADKFHKNVCTSSKQVTAKGTVKEVNGKKELTATDLKTVE